MVECALCKREAPGSKPGFSNPVWSYSVMVITLDFESSDPGSNPGRTSFFLCLLINRVDFNKALELNWRTVCKGYDMIGWPSGLRRQFKALVSSEARVRISSQSSHVVA